MFLNGDGIAGTDARGEPITDDTSCSVQRRRTPLEFILPPRSTPRLGRRDRHRRRRRRPRSQGRVDAAAGGTRCRAERAPEPEAEPDHSVAASVAARRRASRPHAACRAASPDDARRRAAPTGCRSRAASTCTTPPRIAALPARARRRLGLPVAAAGRRAGLRPRLRRRRPRRVDPERGGATGLAALSARGRAGSAWACSSTSCPTTSASPTPR